MKKHKKPTVNMQTERINPFLSAWTGVSSLFRVNRKTTLQVLVLAFLCSLGLVILLGVLALAFTSALASVPQVQLLTGILTQSPQDSAVSTPGLVALIGLLVVLPWLMIAFGLFTSSLLAKVALASIAGKRASAGEVVRAASKQLPALLLLALLILAVNSALLLAMVVVGGIGSTLMLTLGINPALGLLVIGVGAVLLAGLSLFFNLRWFTYAMLAIVELRQNAGGAIETSKRMFRHAPGYTLALALLVMTVLLLLNVLAGVAAQLGGAAAFIASVLSGFAGLLAVGALAVGFTDIRAAQHSSTVLKPSRGSLPLVFAALGLTLVAANMLQPPAQNAAVPKPLPLERTGFPMDNKYIIDNPEYPDSIPE